MNLFSYLESHWNAEIASSNESQMRVKFSFPNCFLRIKKKNPGKFSHPYISIDIMDIQKHKHDKAEILSSAEAQNTDLNGNTMLL